MITTLRFSSEPITKEAPRHPCCTSDSTFSRKRLDVCVLDERGERLAATFHDETAADSVEELTTVNHFIRIARDARIEIERDFRKRGGVTVGLTSL
jgi:hypothetical protein